MSTNRIHELAIKNGDTYILNDANDDVIDAFAYGTDAKAEHNQAVAFGKGTRTSADKQVVIGAYNKTESTGDCVFVVGNGSEESKRSNAHTLDSFGNATYAGTVSAHNLEIKDTAICPVVHTNVLIPTEGNTLAIQRTINGTTIQDPVICASDLTQQSSPYLSLGKHRGNIILTGYNLDSAKKYTVKLMARSRYRGYHTGEWREITAEDMYGYAKLAGKNVYPHNNTLKFPDVPDWMPNKGILQYEWLEALKKDTNYQLSIPCATWLLDICKPLAVGESFLPKYLENSTNSNIDDYIFDGNILPVGAGLYGLSTTRGYRGLDFKFRLYSEDNLLIAETNNFISVSGKVSSDNRIQEAPPSSAYVWLNTNEKKISNIYLKIS